MTDYTIEIATSDFITTKSAVEGGADRIELCANLAEGGTTPSASLIKQCRESFSTLLYPIIRPRGGDFLYTGEEFTIMLNDIKLCRQLGCDGVVLGLLLANGHIDKDRSARLVEAAYPMGVTFHRAFDRCADPFLALKRLIAMGCERILTSGQQPAAPDGVDLIAELNKVANDRLIIMPGSGVRKENIKMLAEKTGCTEFHSSLRGKKQSPMEFIHPAFKDSAESYQNNAIDVEEVKALRHALTA
ncbi:MAG: copper homeostasis protein CutC [Chitinophagaceae bacterium]|nr:copper homeostasis protein CutC [Chitinophagaceae bacterium]